MGGGGGDGRGGAGGRGGEGNGTTVRSLKYKRVCAKVNGCDAVHRGWPKGPGGYLGLPKRRSGSLGLSSNRNERGGSVLLLTMLCSVSGATGLCRHSHTYSRSRMHLHPPPHNEDCRPTCKNNII